MLIKTVTYTDFNGNKCQETLYFNLTKAEAAKMNILAGKNGLVASLQEIVDRADGKSMLQVFEDLILDAYGQKSEDGRRFIKNAEMREAFYQSPAYSEIFMELLENPEKVGDFVSGVLGTPLPATT